MNKKEEESDSKEALNVIEKEVKVTSDYYIWNRQTNAIKSRNFHPWMRNHLRKCLHHKKFEPFPHKRVTSIPRDQVAFHSGRFFFVACA